MEAGGGGPRGPKLKPVPTTGADVKNHFMKLIDNSYKATDLNVVMDELSKVDTLINPNWSESELSFL